MKKVLTILLLLTMLVCMADDSLQVFLSPKTVSAYEPAQLVLRGKSSTPPKLIEKPKVNGLEWLNASRFVQATVVNGERKNIAEMKYSFVVEKEGTYTIPESWVELDGKKIRIEPITFTVKKNEIRVRNKNGSELQLNDTVFSNFLIPDNKTTYYVGEYIPLEIKVYCLPEVKLSGLDYPQISSEKGEIIFRNYQDVNQSNPHFDRPRQGMGEIDGKEYMYYVFRTEIKAIAAGKLILKSQTPTRINIPSERSNRMTDDPFFNSFFGERISYRTISHTLRSAAPELEIKPLPPVPENTYFLGPIGNWKTAASLSSKKTNVGNAITLKLDISGKGDLEIIHPPELKLNGFRIYAPEVSRNRYSVQVRYTLIPTKPGFLPVDLKFCTFSTLTNSYVTSTISEKVTVEASNGIIPVAQTSNVVDTAIPETPIKKQEEHAMAGIMYLKPLSEQDYSQETYFWSWIIGIIAAGILFVIGCEILAYFLRGTSTAAQRRTIAKNQKKKLLAQLEKSAPGQVYSFVPEISEYLNNALDLSPGTDLNESAEWISQKNPELSDELKKLSAGAWVPGAETFSEERKINLMKMLKKLVCLALLGLTATLAAEVTQDDIIKAYDAGEFKKAGEWYVETLNKNGATPALLYNIGNCYYQEKDFARALFCYEKANLLAPRDTEILRNMELARRELNLPSGNQLTKPADIPRYLRDQMTPQEWMILGAVGVLFLLSAFGLRRFFSRRVTLPTASAGVLIMILCAAMVISQYQTTYAQNRAMILENGLQLRTLPTENAGSLNTEVLKEAENVQILERRDKWIRIKAGNAIGWIPAGAAGQFNGRKFSVF